MHVDEAYPCRLCVCVELLENIIHWELYIYIERHITWVIGLAKALLALMGFALITGLPL